MSGQSFDQHEKILSAKFPLLWFFGNECIKSGFCEYKLVVDLIDVQRIVPTVPYDYFFHWFVQLAFDTEIVHFQSDVCIMVDFHMS